MAAQHKLELTLGLQQYPPQETTRLINSPISLEALKMEGISPHDLLYKPLDQFIHPNIIRQISQLRFEDYERRRQELIKIALQKRSSLVIDLKRKKRMTVDTTINIKESLGPTDPSILTGDISIAITQSLIKPVPHPN